MAYLDSKHIAVQDNYNHFVQACAWGDVKTIKVLLEQDKTLLFSVDKSEAKAADGDDIDAHIFYLMEEHAKDRFRDTQNLTGIQAAMRWHQSDVVDLLMAQYYSRDVNISAHLDSLVSAVHLGVSSGFVDGVKKLTQNYKIPLWNKDDRPASDLLFSALGNLWPYRLHSRAASNGTRAELLNAYKTTIQQRAQTLEMIDYLVSEHDLNVNAYNIVGDPFIKHVAFNTANIRVFDYLLKMKDISLFDESATAELELSRLCGDLNPALVKDPNGFFKYLVKKYSLNPNQESIDTDTKRYRVSFSAEIEEDVADLMNISLEDFKQMTSSNTLQNKALFTKTTFMNACYDGDLDCVRFLQKMGGDPLYKSANGANALFAAHAGKQAYAAQSNPQQKQIDDFDAIERLLIEGIPHNRRNRSLSQLRPRA